MGKKGKYEEGSAAPGAVSPEGNLDESARAPDRGSDTPAEAFSESGNGQQLKAEATPDPVPDDELDTYPLRAGNEDPRWAVRTVWIWIGIVLACLTGILILLILGAIYE